ncbi:erythropoietin b [Chanos chanos]|uniref:Erythropoietin n=1 Tax=Chanos chanos TaxID=29144 RepID=A0A6J2WW24_CHACN|nr:erythropoietin-like [Chanos chanos]
MPSVSGLLSVLLLVLTFPGRGGSSPLKPICDINVLDRFIMEARDTEAAMRSCKEGCGLMGTYVLPLVRVDFNVWESKDTQEQAMEVETGLSLLTQTVSAVRQSVTNVRLQDLLDNTMSNILSVRRILRSLQLREQSPSVSRGHTEAVTQEVSTLSELLHVHTNFLRGKVRLLVVGAPVCQKTSS